MSSTVWFGYTLLLTMVWPLMGSAVAAGTGSFLLATNAVEGAAASAAWASVALSAVSACTVIARIIANDRASARAADLKMQSLLAENTALRSRDAEQQVQIDRLRVGQKANTKSIDTLSRTSDSNLYPALQVPAPAPVPVPLPVVIVNPDPVPVVIPDPEKGD